MTTNLQLDDYFAALEVMDPQVNDLVALQARYKRLTQLRARERQSENVQGFEKKLELAVENISRDLLRSN